MIWIPLLLGCLTVGDAVPRDEFAETFAPLFCARDKECARGVYETLYYSRSDCIASWEADLRVQLEVLDDRDCGYDEEEAAAAFDAIKEMSCEDYYEGDELASLSGDIFPGCSDSTTTSYYSYYYTYYDY